RILLAANVALDTAQQASVARPSTPCEIELLGLRGGDLAKLGLRARAIECHDHRGIAERRNERDTTAVGRNRDVSDLRHPCEVLDGLSGSIYRSAAHAQHGGADRKTGNGHRKIPLYVDGPFEFCREPPWARSRAIADSRLRT